MGSSFLKKGNNVSFYSLNVLTSEVNFNIELKFKF